MVLDREKRTVRLPIKVIDGKWKLEQGGELPELKAGAVGHLMVSVSSLVDPVEQDRWTRERRERLLDSGEQVFARVVYKNVPEELLQEVETKHHVGQGDIRFVRITLKQPLVLKFVAGKEGSLEECLCRISVLDDEAGSLNEAYKKIVSVFEPKRRSVSGNVFSVVFVKDGNWLVQLDKLRKKAIERTLSVSGRDEPNSGD